MQPVSSQETRHSRPQHKKKPFQRGDVSNSPVISPSSNSVAYSSAFLSTLTRIAKKKPFLFPLPQWTRGWVLKIPSNPSTASTSAPALSLPTQPNDAYPSQPPQDAAIEVYFHKLLKFDLATPITAPSLGGDNVPTDFSMDDAAYDLLSPLGEDSILPPPCEYGTLPKGSCRFFFELEFPSEVEAGAQWLLERRSDHRQHQVQLGNWSGWPPQSEEHRHNHLSARDFPSDVHHCIQTELAHSAIIGPFKCKDLPFPVAMAPLASVPKECSAHRRVITDCTFGGYAINA